MEDTKPYSLAAIAVVIIFCFPVAIYMIIANVLATETEQKRNAATAAYANPLAHQKPVKPRRFVGLKVFGGILIGIGVLLEAIIIPVGIIEGPIDVLIGVSVLFFVLFIVFGILLCCIASAQTKKSHLKCRYVDIIHHSDDLSIEAIGKQAGQSMQQAYKTIEQMLAQKYFPNCYIDRDAMRFCFPSIEDAAKFGYQTAVISCPSCGARNALICGTIAKCTHCGGVLKADFPKSPSAAPQNAEAQKKTLGDSLRNAATSATSAFERLMNKLFK